MADSLEQGVAAVRSFNRFYTQKIGALGDSHAESPFSLTEVRVLYELAHREQPTATELAEELGLDAGYLSRILRRFEQRGLLQRSRSKSDARQSHLRLTSEGRRTLTPIESRTRDGIAALLAPLPTRGRDALIVSMRTIQEVLEAPGQSAPFTLRSHRPGDMGWVVHRHGALYNQEYGWDEQFEALVAEIVAKFIRKFDPQHERCWIAERDGEILGSIFLVRDTDEVAKLRLLLVEPNARGLGVGSRLVDECTGFARQVGYGRVTLWTQSVLHAARRIYLRAGYQLREEKPHHSFGHDLVAQTWELVL